MVLWRVNCTWVKRYWTTKPSDRWLRLQPILTLEYWHPLLAAFIWNTIAQIISRWELGSFFLKPLFNKLYYSCSLNHLYRLNSKVLRLAEFTLWRSLAVSLSLTLASLQIRRGAPGCLGDDVYKYIFPAKRPYDAVRGKQRRVWAESCTGSHPALCPEVLSQPSPQSRTC